MTSYKYQHELDAFRDAEAAAATATEAYLNAHPNQWYPCGFAWVRIRPARGRFVEMCKDKNFGRVDSYEGGFVIYNPSHNHTQCMDAKAEGAKAFCEVIKKYFPNMKINVQTRID